MSEERHDAPMPLRCGDCGLEWTENFSLPMNVKAFVKKSKSILCPKCGSKKPICSLQHCTKDVLSIVTLSGEGEEVEK